MLYPVALTQDFAPNALLALNRDLSLIPRYYYCWIIADVTQNWNLPIRVGYDSTLMGGLSVLSELMIPSLRTLVLMLREYSACHLTKKTEENINPFGHL